jgi:hypothetical protein
MIGALAAVIITLAGVVAYLFKRYERRDDRREKAIVEERKTMDEERAAWAIEREKLRGDFEAKHAELSDDFANALREEHKLARDHEDEIRAEFAAIMERVATESGKSATALVEMLQKFYDRFVGPRTRY